MFVRNVLCLETTLRTSATICTSVGSRR
jgi:hypothetical protein